MKENSKIYVAGHNGLVGSALLRNLKNQGYNNLIYKNRSELDLLDADKTFEFIRDQKPEYVFLAAAKVGGIAINNEKRADFLYENLQIQQSQKGGDGGKIDENTSGKSSSSSSSSSSDVSSSMQTYHEVGNLDELLDRNHQITTMAKVWETSQDVSETSKEAFRRAHLRRTNCLLSRKAEAGEEEEEEDFGSFGRR